MAATVTFPQSGDQDDAEHFASMIGVSNIMDYVESGGGFTPNYGVPEVSISDITVYISGGNQTASSSGETIRETGEMVQVEGATVSLSDSATNHVYVEPDFGTDDNATFSVYTNTSNASSDALKIGEVNTTADTSVLYNRAPSLSSGTPFEVIDHTDDGNTLLDLPSSGPLDLYVDAQFQNITGTPTFSGHDHTAGGMSTIPNAGLTNSSLTVTPGDGLKSGGSVSLGGTVTLDIEPDDFAGSGVQDDGSDNLELTNNSVTVAGNTVSLGGSTNISLLDLVSSSPNHIHETNEIIPTENTSTFETIWSGSRQQGWATADVTIEGDTSSSSGFTRVIFHYSNGTTDTVSVGTGEGQGETVSKRGLVSWDNELTSIEHEANDVGTGSVDSSTVEVQSYTLG